ncbi:histidine kinase dimerization/phospho-acceptor domain-containing protein [Psychrobacter arenosus]|uniref:histidine kinase dimerization/phospho-acceptor domain-containing protein n=1 Tax=Psychrobacter arenosus TaxID=256326 RepID=UPI00191B785E|nr:histidine kinase dimerization/phospho-acceptor domain-containing protein [Psychrobacter arenosus]
MTESKLADRRLSLLWRTVLSLTLGVILTQILIYAWVQRSVTTHFDHMDSEILTHAAFNLRQRLSNESSDPTIATTNPPSIYNSTAELDYELKAIIANEDGKVLRSMPQDFYSALPQDFSLDPLWQRSSEQQFSLTIGKNHYRAIVIRHSQKLALIALPVEVHHQYLAQFNRQLSWILFAITLLLVSIAALSVYWGFAPLSTISAKMQRINSEQLDDRIAVQSMPRELRPLAESYNAMMDKLERNFDALSRFSADIAHELRTPLASLNTQTQVMLSKPRAVEEYIEQLHHQHETLAQLSGLINNMLLLAKTQKGLRESQLVAVDLSGLIAKLVSYYEWMAEERNIELQVIGEFDSVRGDESLLQRLFANLLSNAIQYAASDSVITIMTSRLETASDLKNNEQNDSQAHSPQQSITISSRLAMSMTQAQADKLTERFHRQQPLSHSQSGTGLGLSIAQAIAVAHRGSLTVRIHDEEYFEVGVRLLALTL